MQHHRRIASITARIVVICALAWLVAEEPATAAPDLQPLFAELNTLNTPNYTGGLPSRNRNLAMQIRDAMRPQFPAHDCPAPDWRQGALFGFSDDRLAGKLSFEGLDPNLVNLLKTFASDRREVRDTAAFAIGQLGPSAKEAIPFLERRLGGGDGPGGAFLKGNWHNDALAKVACETVIGASFRDVIPEKLLPPREPFDAFLDRSAILLATLYLDEDVEYPPGMMAGAYEFYAFEDHAAGTVPLLARILSNPKLSTQKKYETLQALVKLSRFKPKQITPALDAVLAMTGAPEPALRYELGSVLLNLKHPAAIPLLIERIAKTGHYSWEELCQFGVAASAAERPSLDVIADEARWPTDRRAAITLLGCIKSRNAVPVLLQQLTYPDWDTQRAVAIALGKIGDDAPQVRQALTGLASHWSKRVRDAATRALARLDGQPPAAPQPQPNETLVDANGNPTKVEKVTVGGPNPVNHGLPWCDEGGKYSLDGSNWFKVKWIGPHLEPIPARFPFKRFARDGVRQFMRVDDGWLFFTNRGEFTGDLVHVSDSGVVTTLESGEETRIIGMYRQVDAIFAFGDQPLPNGDGGVLFSITRTDGRWRSRSVATLPSEPEQFAASPAGDLLLRDMANSYAIIAGDILPLKCDKVHPGSYFESNSTYHHDDD